MGSINSKKKGARGEREFRDLLKEHGIQARRGQQYSGSPDSPDVVTELDDQFHFEVKRVEKLNIEKAVEQAMNDSGKNQIPIVAHKKNRGKWLITLLANDFIKLIKGEKN